MFNVYADYKDIESNEVFNNLIGSFDSLEEAKKEAVLFEENLDYCGFDSLTVIVEETVESLAEELVELVRNGYTMKQAKDYFRLSESLWLDVVGEYCSISD